MSSIFEKFKNRLKSKSRKIEKKVETDIENEIEISPDKQPIKRILFIVFSSIIALFILAGLVFGIMIYGFKTENKITKTASRIIPFPAAFTSSGIITMADFYHEKDYINHFYLATKQETSVDQKELNKQIMNQLVENKIVNNEAIKMKYKVSDKEINDAMSKIYESNGGQEKVGKTLSELYNLSLKQFKELVATQLIRDKISNEAIEKVTVRHILIRVDENAAEDKINEAKVKVEQISNEIKGGLSFEDAAKKYSEDVGSNEQGGLLDPFGRDEMVKPFEDAAFSAPINEVTKPVRTSFGFHIIKVEKRTGFIDKSFDKWLSDLKSKSIILNFYKF